jgi:Gpi18-like mannosyltransferase/4-amino-4-deoxy-L-arabinose transferase-like glycosyltransferase
VSQRKPVAGVSSAGESGAAGSPLSRREIVNIALLCAGAFVLRLLPIMLYGHDVDLHTFEGWMFTLQQHQPWGFYQNVQFIDYPPGYMLILWIFSFFYALMSPLASHGIDTAIIAVKMPAILADVGLVYLTYLIMRRNWSAQTALLGAAIIAILNPDIAFLSAYWGQADSVATVFLLWALYLALTNRFEWAWACLAFAVLIKPHPIVIAPLLLLWQIRQQGLTWRLASVPIIGLGIAYLGSLPFEPTLALPSRLFPWLWSTYAHGRDGYPYNSVNAFNLYSVKNDFWQSDQTPVMLPSLEPVIAWGIALLLAAFVAVFFHQMLREQIGSKIVWFIDAAIVALVAIPTRIAFNGVSLGPLWEWGIAIFLGFLIAIALRQWRTTAPDAAREARENSFLFACFLVMLGYFMLLTRMHERYIFEAIVLIVLVRPLGPVPRIVTLALAGTFMVDLFYGLYYLKTPSADLNPLLVHSLSLVNVVCFFAVAGVYLIEEFDVAVRRWFVAPPKPVAARASPQLLEGLVGMTRMDWWIAGGLTAATALLLVYRIWVPTGRIFDEIYYARAAQDYLAHQDVFEWTHPPLPKLVMAATAWFFQIGLPAFGAWLAAKGVAFGSFFVRNQIGDPVSSRYACALAGTAMVPILYAFAKRLFSSTTAAVVAVVLLLSSGFFYVQARTALPDIFVALFSLAALYSGYRFLSSGQIVRRIRGAYPDVASLWATAGVSLAIIIFVALEVAYYDPSVTKDPLKSWHVFLVFMAALTAFCVWWALRLRGERIRGDSVVYPDGTVVAGSQVAFPSGEQKPLRAAWSDDAQKATWSADGVALTEGDVALRWQANGTIAGTAGGRDVNDRQRWGVWLVLTGLSLGAVTACKWYGIFDVATLLLAAALVTAQGFLPALWRWRDQDQKPPDKPRRLVWGNPLGWRLPLFLAGVVALGLTVYTMTYIPYFSLSKSNNTPVAPTFQDMLALQHEMYGYHHDLVATHPFSSPWWSWPIDLRPVAYDTLSFSKPGDPVQIHGEIIALPNPLVWVFGLITIPFAALLAWRQRHKGILILVGAAFLHWLPWVGSPRIDFQYNIFNNTAIVCLCTTYVLLWAWQKAQSLADDGTRTLIRLGAAGYLVLCVALFIFFYPVLSDLPLTDSQFGARMWIPVSCDAGNKHCIGWN